MPPDSFSLSSGSQRQVEGRLVEPEPFPPLALWAGAPRCPWRAEPRGCGRARPLGAAFLGLEGSGCFAGSVFKGDCAKSRVEDGLLLMVLGEELLIG